MATLFDSASLALIPSGVKDGKLYSIKPTDGSGDFTFSRGTDTATRVNSDGLIEKERSNQILQSNSFDTTWTTSSTSVTGGQSGYDGSSDAWLLSKSAANGHIRQNITTSGVKTFSIYAKANTSNWIRLRFDNSAGDENAWINISNGSIGSDSGIATYTTDIGSGWYRLAIQSDSTNLTNFRIYPAEGDNDSSATSGSIYIQDAQLEYGLVATDYIETTTAAVYKGITDNLPRLDYSGGASCPSLLIEPSRTNGIAQSEYFESWTQDGITTSSNTTDTLSPEGLYNASKITAVSGNQRIYVGSTHSAGVITGSFYVKAGTTDVITFNASSFLITYNLTTLAVTETIGTGTITPVGNGWYRVTATSAVSASANRTPEIIINTASAGEYCYIYGAMIGVANYETSYIPTYETSASRAADFSSNNDLVDTPIAIGANDDFTFYYEGSFDKDGANGMIMGGGVAGAAADSQSYWWVRSSELLLAGNGQVTMASASFAAVKNTNYKILVKRNGSLIDTFVNGTKLSTTQSATNTAFTFRSLGWSYSNSVYKVSGNIKQAMIFLTGLTDQEAIDLTTI